MIYTIYISNYTYIYVSILYDGRWYMYIYAPYIYIYIYGSCMLKLTSRSFFTCTDVTSEWRSPGMLSTFTHINFRALYWTYLLLSVKHHSPHVGTMPAARQVQEWRSRILKFPWLLSDGPSDYLRVLPPILKRRPLRATAALPSHYVSS